MISIGHPNGAPFAFHTALAHFESDRLDAFCIPWMPSRVTLDLLDRIAPIRPLAARLSRRHFEPLARAPMRQGRLGEILRLVERSLGGSEVRVQVEANEWLMRTMAEECARASVTAIHAPEDCALWQFREARRRGKACIYDMPIGYYGAWSALEASLVARYGDWFPGGALQRHPTMSVEQKREEMQLADLVFTPSTFSEKTIQADFPHKKIVVAKYGADLAYWTPPPERVPGGPLRFVYAGQLSVRKGIPTLIEAWNAAQLDDAELRLVGSWQLAQAKRAALPANVVWEGPCSLAQLREHYRSGDVFVFPSFFEGYGLVLAEAMACGMPVLYTDATAGPDIAGPGCGRMVPAGDVDALAGALQWFDAHRSDLKKMGKAARSAIEGHGWDQYRRNIKAAVTGYL